jgi:hypothetical protein
MPARLARRPDVPPAIGADLDGLAIRRAAQGVLVVAGIGSVYGGHGGGEGGRDLCDVLVCECRWSSLRGIDR